MLVLLLASLLCWRPCCCLYYCGCGSHHIDVIVAVAVTGATALACIPAVAVIAALAGVPLFPDVLSVAGLPAIAGIPHPWCHWLNAVVFFPVGNCVPAIPAVLAL
jgi:hypothetical protein